MINNSKIKDLAPLMRKADWLDTPLIPKIKPKNFLFVLDSISFAYWGEPKWTVNQYDGAYALVYSLSRALEESVPILDPLYLKNLPRRDLEYILRGNTEIPMLEERWKILRDLGKFLSINPRLSDDALTFVNEISRLYWFNDTQNGMRFNKKAQLLANDLKLTNRNKLYGCADYKIPQVLRHYGILQYSESLREKIIAHHIFNPNDTDVINIRVNTLRAIRLLSQYSNHTRMSVNDSLWLLGQKKMDEPYHRCRTIYY